MGCRASRPKKGDKAPLISTTVSTKISLEAKTQDSVKEPSLPDEKEDQKLKGKSNLPPLPPIKEEKNQNKSAEKVPANLLLLPRTTATKAQELPPPKANEVAASSMPGAAGGLGPVRKQRQKHKCSYRSYKLNVDQQQNGIKQHEEMKVLEKCPDNNQECIGFEPGIELAEDDEIPAEAIERMKMEESLKKKICSNQFAIARETSKQRELRRRRRRPRYRQMDEDDTLYEIGRDMPVVDFSEEFFESRKKATL